MSHRIGDQRVALWELAGPDTLAARTADHHLDHVVKFLDGRDPTDISELDLRRSLRDRRDAGWAPATQIYRRRALRHFREFAVERRWVDENPVAGIPWPTDEERPVRAAGPDIERALLDVARCHRDSAMVAVLFGTGRRVGELARLRVTDIDVTAGPVLIERSKARRPRIVTVGGDERRRLLHSWLEIRLARHADHDHLWTRLDDDDPLSPSSVAVTLRRLAKRAGVQFSPHDARRGKSEAWIAAGGSEVGLMRAAGWSSNRMVQWYTRTHGEQLTVGESERLFG